MRALLKRLLPAVFVSAILYGCAAPPLPDLYWPDPPDPPRVKFVTAYYGSGDFKAPGGMSEALLGKESVDINLRKPMSVHVDGSGKIYVTDTAASDVIILDKATKTGTTIGAMGSRVFTKPIGVSTDSSGRIYVTDSQANNVAVLDRGGNVVGSLAANEPLNMPSGIATDSARKKIYVTDTRNHNIKVFDMETLKQTNTIGRRGKGEGEFNFPSHIAVGPGGKLYVTDTQNGRVQIFDNEGKFIRTFGQFGDAPGMFGRPKGIGVDSEGHIYVADAAFNNVQIFDEEGQILLSFSGYGENRSAMILPAGLTVDKDDYIYVVDSWNRRINVFEYLGDKHKERLAKEKK
ncbi:MAG: 6-bladed beta-propeller [Deltaproteobacteria bacterium]|nr:6-bladed beta-propeller [Deltaproteobacteria bacterium]